MPTKFQMLIAFAPLQFVGKQSDRLRIEPSGRGDGLASPLVVRCFCKMEIGRFAMGIVLTAKISTATAPAITGRDTHREGRAQPRHDRRALAAQRRRTHTTQLRIEKPSSSIGKHFWLGTAASSGRVHRAAFSQVVLTLNRVAAMICVCPCRSTMRMPPRSTSPCPRCTHSMTMRKVKVPQVIS